MLASHWYQPVTKMGIAVGDTVGAVGVAEGAAGDPRDGLQIDEGAAVHVGDEGVRRIVPLESRAAASRPRQNWQHVIVQYLGAGKW